MKIREHALRALKDHPEHESYEFCQEQIIPNRGAGTVFLESAGLMEFIIPKTGKST